MKGLVRGTAEAERGNGNGVSLLGLQGSPSGGMPPPTRPHLLILLKQLHQPGTT